MKKSLKEYTIRDLVEGFVYSDAEGRGLYGLNGTLTIQPEYQRNYLYGDGKRDARVIESILAGRPLGVFYFNVLDSGHLEVLDGQQRVTSVGRYIKDAFAVSVDGVEHYFSSLDADAQRYILDTTIIAYLCSGTEAEVKAWFEAINVEGIAVNEQELLNAVYSGPFVTAAKRVFSRTEGNAFIKKWAHYVKGSANRQDYLATALRWVSNGEVADYMARHRTSDDISELRLHFDTVLAWAAATFTDDYRETQGLDWGRLYRQYGAHPYKADEVAKQVKALYADPAVTAKRGIFEYVLDANSPSPVMPDADRTRLLNVRLFSKAQSSTRYTQQTTEAEAAGTSNCSYCAVGGSTKIWPLSGMGADHVTAWSKGGATDLANCEMLCTPHNKAKGNA